MSLPDSPTGAAAEQQPASTKILYRIRLVYSRGKALRYVSHLDMQMVWERTLRRSGLPLAYSQGFSPRPRLHLASALPLGFLSRCEITDVWLEMPAGSPDLEPDDLLARIQASAPPGLVLEHAGVVPLNLPALQTQVQSAEYLATPLDPMDFVQLSEVVEQILAAEQLPRERRGKPGSKGKAYDLRPLIEALEIRPALGESDPRRAGLFMRLAAREGATGRPEELLAALGQDAAAWRIERTNLILAENRNNP